MDYSDMTRDELIVELRKAQSRVAEIESAFERQREEFNNYRLLFSGISDLAYICDTTGRILFINDIFEKLSGRKVSEFTGKLFAPLFDDENLARAIDNYERTLKGESPVYEIYFKDTGVLCQYRNMPIKDADGTVTGVMGIARDITLERRVERELQRKSALLSEAHRLARMGCWEWDIKTNRMTWSDELYAVFGLDPVKFDPNAYEDFLGRLHGGDWENVEAVVERALKDKKPYEVSYRYFQSDGEVRHIYSQGEVVCDPSGSPVRIVGTCQDRTDWKSAGEKAGESERKFRYIFENAFDGMLLAEPETRRLYLGNKRICKELGYGPGEISSLRIDDIHPAEELPRVFEEFGKHHNFNSRISEDIPVKRRDGSVFYANITSSFITLSGKKYMLGIFRDTTELRKAYEEMRKYKNNFEAIFRSVRDSIITVDNDRRIIEINEAAESLCGLSRDCIGEKFYKLKCDKRCLEALIKTIEEKKSFEMYRIQCRRCDNKHNIISISTRPLVGEKGEFSGAVLVIKDETRIADLERDLSDRKRLHNFIGQSEKIQSVFSFIETLAQTRTTVLLTGESGTGKELAAEALHYTGARRDKPLVKVNCAALSQPLLESELFGHARGAFTGAVRDRIGRFELADGGTIFLDEIGDISHEVQVRLLRVLQEREFERVGDSKTRRVDIRIIAATNRDLAERVRRGKFREDLYYRLKVVELALPSLRDRLEDLPLLAGYFIKRLNRKFNKNIDGISEDVQAVLMSYPWPGNVRELEHTLEHACILCDDRIISTVHLPPGFQHVLKRRTPAPGTEEQEREDINRALEKTAGNKARAARLLGMSRRTIYRRMERLGMAGED